MDPRVPGGVVSITRIASDGTVPDAEAGRPSLCGFEVRSSVPFLFQRIGGGREVLTIVEQSAPAERPSAPPLSEWTLLGAAEPAQASLYRTPRGYEFWTTDTGRFVVEPESGFIEIPSMDDTILREQRLCGIPTVLSYLHRGDCSLHAAAVEIDGGAVLFAAPSKFGKTTLALAFHVAGHRVLSEDLACCRPATGEILPGPAVVRLRPDVYGGTAPVGMHIAAERSDRVFLVPDDPRKGTSTPVPIRAIVFLREGDALRLEPADPRASLSDLWTLSFRLPTDEDRGRSFRDLTRILGAAPVWNLYRPMSLDTLAPTVRLVADRLARE